MNILLVLILAALIGMVAMKSRIPASQGVVVVLCMLCLLPSACQQRTDVATYDESDDATVGRILGEIMAGELPEGGQALVIDTSFEPGEDPWVDARFAGLTEGWGKVGFEAVRIDPRMLVSYEADRMSEAVDAVYEGYAEIGPLMRILEQHPDAVALVSFVGLPYNISAKGLAALPSVYLGKRGVLSVSSDQLIKQDNIRAIVEMRPVGAPDPDPSELEGLPEVFRSNYRLLTSDPADHPAP